MSKIRKIFEQILRGKSDANIEFQALCNLMTYLGFEMRIKGSHHNQVRQVRNLIIKYKLGDDLDEQV